MGTWDIGLFDNDTAADWCNSLDDASADARQGMILTTLARAADTTHDLDADVSEEAVAAAALVAAQCPGGEPADLHYGPEEPLSDLTGLLGHALQALDRVITEPSELLELWSEAGGGPWLASINRLRDTLTPRPPGEQLQLSCPSSQRNQSFLIRKVHMSWDVLLLRLPGDITSVQDIPDDYTPLPLGRQNEVLAAVSHAAPEADLSDPTWSEVLGPTWSIELNIGEEDPVDSLMLHIRGSGDDVLTPVFRLAGALGCKVLDCSTGDLLITPQGLSSWHAFQEFRDDKGATPAPDYAQNSMAASSVAPYSAEDMTALTSFTFVRHIDGLRYIFERDGERNGRPAYRRTDGNVWCVWSPTDGWHCEIADGLVTAHPLNSHAEEPEPPATVWRSFKNDRSYLYDLRTLDLKA